MTWSKLGLHPFHLPLGVQLTQDAHGQATTDSRCIRCDRVDGFPCLLGAKADAEWAVIRPALAAHPNLTLITRTTAERLLTDASGRSVTGVAVTLSDGSPDTFTADIVVLSAGAILSAALLLKSANDEHPHGLANSSDLVGRNYMRHNNLALIAFSREPNPTVFAKTLALNDFYRPSEHWQYPMGHIQMLGKSDDWQIKAAAPRGLGRAPSAPYGEVAKHSIDFWLSSEDLPLADSRITLRPDGAIRLALEPGNNTEGLTRLRRTFQGMLGKLGMVDTTFVRSLYLHKAFDACRHGPPGGHGTLRDRPVHLGPRRALQGPRPRQPLRGGRQLHALGRCREPHLDHHRERAARGRSHRRAHRNHSPLAARHHPQAVLVDRTHRMRDLAMPKIEDYALLGDLHTAALVSTAGSVDWLCLPRFDSPAAFAALLHNDEAGRWILAPLGASTCTNRRYAGNTLVLETDWVTADGAVRVIDFMPPRANTPHLIRIAVGLSGEVAMRSVLRLRFDYGRVVPWIRHDGTHAHAIAGPDRVRLVSAVPVYGHDWDTFADFTVRKGDRVPFVMSWAPGHEPQMPYVDAEQALSETEDFWTELG